MVRMCFSIQDSMEPKIINGGRFSDVRGTITYNNDFDASVIKRVYTIQNSDTNFIRGWQGHKIEQRWFSAIVGVFRIKLIKIDNWDNPSKAIKPYVFTLQADKMDILYVPAGFISSIRALEENSLLLVMADYFVGKVKDEYRFEKDYFENI